MALPKKDMIDISNLRVSDPVTVACLNLTFSNKLLIDRWCSFSRIINHISNHGFKSVGSVISTDKSDCCQVPRRRCFKYTAAFCHFCGRHSCVSMKVSKPEGRVPALDFPP